MRLVVYVTIVLGFILFLLISLETPKTETTKICFEDNICFDVWIARTNLERERGLMNVESLEENQGMLFVFSAQGNHTFWMKNTLIPLDMVWLNSDLEVVDISRAVPCKQDPCTIYSSKKPVMYVLEISGDLSDKFQILEGNVLTIG